jgi:hypothetical protein
MAGAIAMTVTLLIMAGIAFYLVGSLVRSIQNTRRPGMKVLKNYGLSIAFCTLFLVSWAGHAVASWQHYTDEQRQHRAPVEAGDFMAQFSEKTLENWQSEFLQLFSFTVLAAVLIHRGSAESKDGDEQMQQALKRIEEKLGTTPVR